MIKLTLLFILLFKYSSQQTTNVDSMEKDMMTSMSFLDSRLKRLSISTVSCAASAKVSSSNLKAASMGKNLTDPLDNLVNYVNGIQIPPFFESFTKCVGLSTCECLAYRIVMLDTFSKKISSFNQQFSSSSLDIQKILSTMTWNYAANYRKLQTIWTREASILRAISQTRILLNNFVDTIRNFLHVKKYFDDWKSYLTSDISSCTFGNSTFYQDGSPVDENLRIAQKKVQDVCSAALVKVSASLSTAAPGSSAKPVLNSLSNRLKEIATCDDYLWPNVTWPKIPDITGQASSGKFMKVRTCFAKTESYSFTRNDANRNKTDVTTLLNAFKAAVSVTSSRKVGASAQDLATINATNDVVNSLNDYISKLNASIDQVDTMRKNIDASICGFTIDLASNYPSDSSTFGFNSGIYKDGSILYPGTGTYLGALKPARISTKNPAGAYSPSGSVENFDPATANFFRAHPNLKWTTTTAPTAALVSGKISVNGASGLKNYVTRLSLAGFNQIGMIAVYLNGTIDGVSSYFDGTSVVTSAGTVEILVC